MSTAQESVSRRPPVIGIVGAAIVMLFTLGVMAWRFSQGKVDGVSDVLFGYLIAGAMTAVIPLSPPSVDWKGTLAKILLLAYGGVHIWAQDGLSVTLIALPLYYVFASWVHGESVTKQDVPDAQFNEVLPEAAPQRTVGVAYIALLTGGLVGAHRFYLGRWATGILYLLSCGGMGVLWVIDLFLLPRLVRTTNERVAARFAEDPGHFAEYVPAGGYTTDSPTGIRRLFQTAWVIGLFWMGMGGLIIMSLLMEEWFFVAFWVGFAPGLLLIGRGRAIAEQKPALMSLPVVGDVIEALGNIESFYATHRPHRAIYYLLTPIIGPFRHVFNDRERTEFRLAAIPLSLGIMGVLVHHISGYLELYPPFLGPRDFYDTVLAIAGFVFFVSAPVVMCMVSTATTLTFNRRRGLLKTGIFGALAIAAIWFWSAWDMFTEGRNPANPARSMLACRVDNPDYLTYFEERTEMFIGYHSVRLADRDIPTEVAQDEALTQSFQSFYPTIGCSQEFKFLEWWDMYCVPEEADVFSVYTVDSGGHRWMALTWADKAHFLVADDQGRIYRSFADLPPSAHALWTKSTGPRHSSVDKTAVPRWSETLIVEFNENYESACTYDD